MPSSGCPEGVNQNTALLATAAAIAVGAGVIYRAVTLQQAGRRRRDAPDTPAVWAGRMGDILALGEPCHNIFISKYQESLGDLKTRLQIWK